MLSLRASISRRPFPHISYAPLLHSPVYVGAPSRGPTGLTASEPRWFSRRLFKPGSNGGGGSLPDTARIVPQTRLVAYFQLAPEGTEDLARPPISAPPIPRFRCFSTVRSAPRHGTCTPSDEWRRASARHSASRPKAVAAHCYGGAPTEFSLIAAMPRPLAQRRCCQQQR